MTKHVGRLIGIPYGPLHRGLEHKDNTNPQGFVTTEEVKRILAEFNTGFKEYREKNDKRLEEIAKKGTSDVVTKDELKKMDDAFDVMQKKLNELALEQKRPVVGEDVTINGQKRNLTDEEVQHKTDFAKYFRKGDVSQVMTKIEEKALSAGSNPDGGYTVPIQVEMSMNRLLSEAGNFRAIAQVQSITTGLFQKPFNLGGAAAGWVGEQTARPQTTAPTLARFTFPVHELYAMPAATQTLLDDSAINVEEWLANEVRITFSEQEEQAFVTGNGVAKPMGFLSYPTVLDTSWVWEKLGYILTGVSGALDANEADDLIDLVYTIKAGYRANARWIMNRLSLAMLRKIKDGNDNYIWQPGMTLGQPSSILGYPVTESEEMPDFAADSFPIAFGDFRSGYLIVDRIGIRVLRDPFTAKPFILFYTTKRVGGGVQNFEAIKLLKAGTA